MFMPYTHSYFPLHISHVNPMLFILTYSHITIYICVWLWQKEEAPIWFSSSPHSQSKLRHLCLWLCVADCIQLPLLLPFPGRIYKYPSRPGLVSQSIVLADRLKRSNTLKLWSPEQKCWLELISLNKHRVNIELFKIANSGDPTLARALLLGLITFFH